MTALFTLANSRPVPDPNGVTCRFWFRVRSSIIHYPRLEQKSDHPRAAFGMFDPSARACVPVDILTFAIPMKKFERMIDSMDESFLITPTWDKVKTKIARVMLCIPPEKPFGLSRIHNEADINRLTFSDIRFSLL